MKKWAWLGFIGAVLAVILLPEAAWAQGATGEDIFDSLADRAQTIGEGLRGSGYIIAGSGLIVFSFLAIFNKIKWSTLAYIMLSCFVLSAMAFVIDFFQGDGSNGYKSDITMRFTSGYNVTSGSNADSVEVSK